MIASLVLSVAGAINPALPAVSAFFCLAALITEPLKLVFNRVIWKAVAATRRQRFGAFVAYLLCICVSVGLTHLLVERLVGGMIAEDDARAALESTRRAAADKAGAQERAELKALESDLEAARAEVVPVPMTEAQVRAKLLGQTNRAERDLLTKDLATLQRNAQAEAKVRRFTTIYNQRKEKFELSEAERARTFAGRPPDANVRVVRDVRDVRGQLSVLAIFLAFILEMGISGGVWADQLYNRRHTTIAQEIGRPRGSDDADDRLPASSEAFREWLKREWKRKRAKDGWLEGAQHEWSRQHKVTPGFVHHQLKRMEKQGLIQKRTSAKKTWVRFVEKPNLKLVSET